MVALKHKIGPVSFPLVILADKDTGEPMNAGSGEGGGGAGVDRELVVSTYRCKTAFTGASIGDTITCTQVIDVTAAPSTVSVIWRNQTTAADLGGAPSAADLELTGSTALTDAQLRAAAVPVSAASMPLPTGAATQTTLGLVLDGIAAQILLLDGLEGVLGATTGAAVITNADGTAQQYLRGLVIQAAADRAAVGATIDAAAGANQNGSVIAQLRELTKESTQLPATLGPKNSVGSFPIVGAPIEFAVVGSTVTREANTTAYAANDAVSNAATAASVTPVTFTAADFNDMPLMLRRMRVHTNDTGFVAANFAAYVYQTDPTASTGVVGGDNAAFSTKKGTFLGRMSGQFRTFSDGAVAVLTPDEGSEIISLPTSGAKTLFALFQTLSAATPSANGTTFIPTLEGFQGRA